MSILVTGGAGYIASHMTLRLLEMKERVTVIDDLSTGRRSLVPPEVEFIEGDIADRSLLDRVLGTGEVGAVVHFAGSIVVPESVADPLGYYSNNTAKSRSLLKACVDHRIPRFVFSSTAAVYGEPEIVPVAETAPLTPINPYGRSKLMTEWMLEDVARAHGLKYAILRYFNVAGADEKGRSGQASPRATHLIKTACEVASGKRAKLSIFGTDYDTRDGTCIRDYIHVTDLAEAHIDALNYLSAGGSSDVFNCGYGRGATVLEVVDALNRILGREISVELSPRRAGDPMALVASAQKIRKVLGWRPRHDDLDFIIRTALAWERKLGA